MAGLCCHLFLEKKYDFEILEVSALLWDGSLGLLKSETSTTKSLIRVFILYLISGTTNSSTFSHSAGACDNQKQDGTSTLLWLGDESATCWACVPVLPL